LRRSFRRSRLKLSPTISLRLKPKDVNRGGLITRPRTIGEEEFEKRLTAADATTLGIDEFSFSVVSIRAEWIVRSLFPCARCEEFWHRRDAY
jgi:hypothetical protein